MLRIIGARPLGNDRLKCAVVSKCCALTPLPPPCRVPPREARPRGPARDPPRGRRGPRGAGLGLPPAPLERARDRLRGLAVARGVYALDARRRARRWLRTPRAQGVLRIHAVRVRPVRDRRRRVAVPPGAGRGRETGFARVRVEPARLAAASAGRTRRSPLSPAPVAESAAPEPT